MKLQKYNLLSSLTEMIISLMCLFCENELMLTVRDVDNMSYHWCGSGNNSRYCLHAKAVYSCFSRRGKRIGHRLLDHSVAARLQFCTFELNAFNKHAIKPSNAKFSNKNESSGVCYRPIILFNNSTGCYY